MSILSQQDREFCESADLAFNGAANKPSSTPPLTPSPSVNSLDNPGRQSGCCARRPSHKKYQVKKSMKLFLLSFQFLICSKKWNREKITRRQKAFMFLFLYLSFWRLCLSWMFLQYFVFEFWQFRLATFIPWYPTAVKIELLVRNGSLLPRSIPYHSKSVPLSFSDTNTTVVKSLHIKMKGLCSTELGDGMLNKKQISSWVLQFLLSIYCVLQIDTPLTFTSNSEAMLIPCKPPRHVSLL